MAYQKKGNNGGRREGAGRPFGSVSALDYGETAAIRAARRRIPKDSPPELALLADRSLQRIVDVMEERVYFDQARNVLSAATRVREEVCGPLAQKHEHSGADGVPLVSFVFEKEKPPEGE